MDLVICGGQRLVVAALAWALEDRGHAVRTALDLESLVDHLERSTPDVCLLDGDLEPDTYLAAIAEASSRFGALVVVLAGEAGMDRRVEAVEAGAAACVDKATGIDQLVEVLAAVQAGSAGMVEAPRPRERRPGNLGQYLTPRELDALRGMVWGENTSALARRLGVRPATARTHIQNVLTKLCVHTRLAAVAYAVEHGLVDPAPPQRDAHDRRRAAS